MVKTISELTVSNLTVSKYLDISNTRLNQICQIGAFTAEASPGRGKKRALTFDDVFTLRIIVELRHIAGKGFGKDPELVAAAQKISNKLMILARGGHEVDFTCIIQLSYGLSCITNVPTAWLSLQNEDCIDIAEYLEKPYYAVSFFLLRPLFEEVVEMFEIVKAHSKQEKRRLKRETDTIS